MNLHLKLPTIEKVELAIIAALFLITAFMLTLITVIES